MTDDQLEELGVQPDGILQLKKNAKERVEETRLIGEDDIWSSANLYAHLERLQTLIPKLVSKPPLSYEMLDLMGYQNEAAARAWIDAFFFRLSAMMPQDQTLVLSLEQKVPPTAVKPSSTTTLHGIIDYTAVKLSKTNAGEAFIWLTSLSLAWLNPCIEVFSEIPTMNTLRSIRPAGLVVTEAKSFTMRLEDHIPQAVGEMYACAKSLGSVPLPLSGLSFMTTTLP